MGGLVAMDKGSRDRSNGHSAAPQGGSGNGTRTGMSRFVSVG